MICMKRFCFYLFVLACVACRNKPEYTFTGELYSTEGISYRLSLQGNDTTASIVPDSCHRFSVTLPAGNIPFFNFNGVVTERRGEVAILYSRLLSEQQARKDEIRVTKSRGNDRGRR